jgi:hypothetical protein
VEDIIRGHRVLEPYRLAGKRGGFGGEQVERSYMEVWNKVWQMRTELN